jgi:hypothetical protein
LNNLGQTFAFRFTHNPDAMVPVGFDATIRGTIGVKGAHIPVNDRM